MVSSNHDMNLIIKAKDQASGIINKTLGDWKTAVMGVVGAYAAIEGVKSIIGGIIKNGMEAERTWNDVAASLKRHHYEVRQNIEAIQEFSSRMQRQTGISDELVGRGIQRLLDANMKLGDTYRVIQSAADLAAAKDMDLMAATELLAKASMGVTDTLTRYGIVIKDNIPTGEKFAAVLEQINQRFGGAAQANMDTVAGKWKLIKENISDLTEELYTFLFINDSVIGGTDALNATLERLARGLKIWREEGFLAMIRAEEEEKASIKRWEEWAERMGKVQDKSLWGIDSVRRLAEMNKMLHETQEIVVNFPTGPMSDAIDSMTELHEYMTSMAAAEEAAHINFLADVWMKQKEMYSNAVIQMKEEELEVLTEFDELISSNAFKEVDKRTKYELNRVREAESQKLSFSRAAASGMYAAFGTASNAIIGQLTFLQKTSGGIFGAMARDFTKYFIEAALEALAKVFVTKALKILGGMFDNPVNDAMAARQGADFVKYFTKGVTQGLQNIGSTIALNVPANLPQLAYAGGGTTYQNITLNFSGTQVDSRFVEDELIPAIEKAVTYGQSKIVTRNENLTGRRDVQFR